MAWGMVSDARKMGETEGRVLGRVTVYSVLGCPHCVQAKTSLGRLGLPVCDVDMGKHPELRDSVKELTGRSTVPQIFFNSVHIGGNDDLQELLPEELERLVRLVREEPVLSEALPLPEENQSDGSDTAEEADGEFKCERHALADVVEDLKQSDVIGCQWRGLSMCRNSFTGAQLVGWLQKKRGMEMTKACETGQMLLDRKYMVGVAGAGKGEGFGVSDRLYRLMERNPHSALNAGQTAACSPLQAAELSAILRNMILKLFSEYLSSDGKCVDYKAMSLSPVFERYCELAVQLQRVELLSLTREEKLAFFINTYNALVIHGNVRMGAPTNTWQRYKFFNYVSYLIGGEVFTLQDIENGVLRGNRKGVAQLLKPFSKTDPRLQVALPDAEPLIHFALNCGAMGCPPIKTYTPQDIDSQLRTAAESFLENDDGCVVDSEKGEVRLSQIFKWYKADFGGTDEKLLNWILEHMGDSPKRSSLQSVLSSGKIKVSYLPYDWSTNSSH
uniref:DEP domain-containing protein n=2 Tax=Oncorhynchus tshawytscha TaxID=74940 RepID=A0A8C8JX76_ONCTS